MKKFRDDLAEQGGFVLALVAETEFQDTPICPHCNSHNTPHQLEHTMELASHLGELMLCDECVQAFLLLTYPTIMYDDSPIFLNISLKNIDQPLLVKGMIDERIGQHINKICQVTIDD